MKTTMLMIIGISVIIFLLINYWMSREINHATDGSPIHAQPMQITAAPNPPVVDPLPVPKKETPPTPENIPAATPPQEKPAPSEPVEEQPGDIILIQ